MCGRARGCECVRALFSQSKCSASTGLGKPCVPDRRCSPGGGQAGPTSVSRPAFRPMTRQLCESSAAACRGFRTAPHSGPVGVLPGLGAPRKWHLLKGRALGLWVLGWFSVVGSQSLRNPARVWSPGPREVKVRLGPKACCSRPLFSHSVVQSQRGGQSWVTRATHGGEHDSGGGSPGFQMNLLLLLEQIFVRLQEGVT